MRQDSIDEIIMHGLKNIKDLGELGLLEIENFPPKRKYGLIIFKRENKNYVAEKIEKNNMIGYNFVFIYKDREDMK